jgi:hypothetical protein
MEDKALPMKTIYQPNGNPYLSIIDDDPMIKIQLHSYDKDYARPIFLNIDKRCLSELIQALETMEEW